MTFKPELKKISEISFLKSKSWEDLYLTFDIDWAHDEVIQYTIDILEKYDASATFFVTHYTPLIDRLKENPNFELGIHPNFNKLLMGDFEAEEDYIEVISRLMDIVPEARSVRSHSTTQSSLIQVAFVDVGLTHDVNHFIPFNSEMRLYPWLTWDSLIKVPYCWEDDVHCLFGQQNQYCHDPLSILKSTNQSIKVINFHPIHIYLNTEILNRYSDARNELNNPIGLQKRRFNGFGSCSRLIELLENLKL